MSGKPPHIHLSFILALDPDKQFLLHYVKEKLVSDLWRLYIVIPTGLLWPLRLDEVTLGKN